MANAIKNISGRITDYFRMIRVYQWYKNLVIFLPIFFAKEFIYPQAILLTAVGFLALCLISSANYVLNDIVDLKKDRLHPEKKHRPLASGKINIVEATALFAVMLIFALIIAFILNKVFFMFTIALFILTTAYSLWLKNEPVVDVITIAVNFVIRSVAGAFITGILISPWLIVCPLFVAIFLSVGKRRSDLLLMKDEGVKHREVLKMYTPELTNALMIISTTCLIMSYSLYALTKSGWLLITIPFALYTIFRYYMLADSEIARNPEKFYKDAKLLTSLIAWTIILFLVVYFAPHTSGIFLG